MPKVSHHKASGVDRETLSTDPDLGTELGSVKRDAYIILRPPSRKGDKVTNTNLLRPVFQGLGRDAGK